MFLESRMELQRLIHETPNYETVFKEHGLKVKRRRGVLLVTQPYNTPIGDSEWHRYCRGALIDTSTQKVISVPPIKAHEITSAEELQTLLGAPNVECQPLIEGTMINLCFHQGEWLLSTRSGIGGHNKWRTDPEVSLSFHEMFRECVDPDDLDPAYTYSFVMRHPLNRIVAPVHQKEAYLVEVSEMTGDTVRRLPKEAYPSVGPQVVDTMDAAWVHDLWAQGQKGLCYQVKGFTLKIGKDRYKWVNPAYVHVQTLKPNTNSPYLNYLMLRQTGQLNEFLRYFPEYQGAFAEYRREIHRLTNELYTTYKNVRVYQTHEVQTISFHLRPLVYALHGLYLESRRPTTWADAKQYVHTMPPKQLLFAIHHQGVSETTCPPLEPTGTSS